MTLKARGHQKRSRQRFRRITSGEIEDKFTLCDVTPGGGKTRSGVDAGDICITSGFVEQVLWLTPRRTLCSQAERDWASTIRKNGPLIRWAKDGCLPLIRGADVRGCGSTYQNVSANEKAFVNLVREKPTLLILDEMQHLIDPAFRNKTSADWIKSVIKLHEAAKHTLGLSGTIQRHDEKPLPFVTWRELQGGLFVPIPDVTYTKAEAISERAIVPTDFVTLSGVVSYVDKDGVERSEDMGDVSPRIAIGAGLNRDFDYCGDLLELGVDRWMSRNRLSKRSIPRAMSPDKYIFGHIIACESQESARRTVDDLATKHGLSRDMVALAISDGDPSHPHYSDALSEIDRFRGRRALCLVAVGMAHEGLNVPHAKHLTCMTNIRSIPWRDQLFGRINRFDRDAAKFGIPYEKQRAVAVVQSDADMNEYVKNFLEDQYSGIDFSLPAKRDAGLGGGRQRPTNVALGAESTGEDVTPGSTLDATDDTDPLDLPEPMDRGPTPSEREELLSKEVRGLIASLSRALGLKRHSLEAQVKRLFKKSMPSMSPEELESAREFLKSRAARACEATRSRSS